MQELDKLIVEQFHKKASIGVVHQLIINEQGEMSASVSLYRSVIGGMLGIGGGSVVEFVSDRIEESLFRGQGIRDHVKWVIDAFDGAMTDGYDMVDIDREVLESAVVRVCALLVFLVACDMYNDTFTGLLVDADSFEWLFRYIDLAWNDGGCGTVGRNELLNFYHDGVSPLTALASCTSSDEFNGVIAAIKVALNIE